MIHVLDQNTNDQQVHRKGVAIARFTERPAKGAIGHFFPVANGADWAMEPLDSAEKIAIHINAKPRA